MKFLGKIKNLERKDWCLLIALFLSTSIIFYFSFHPGLSWDEASYLLQARNLYYHGEYAPEYSRPPIFSFIIYIFYLFGGYNKVLARIVPIVFGVLSSILIFLFVKKVFDKTAAVFAFVFFILSPFYILLSSRILTESVSWFFLCSSIFAFWYAEKKDSVKNHLLAGGLTAITFLTRYQLGTLAIAFVVYHLFFKRNHKILYFIIAMLITLTPWLMFSKEKCGSFVCLLLDNFSAATTSNVPFYYYLVTFLGAIGFIAPIVIYGFVKNYKNRFLILLALFILILIVGLTLMSSKQFRFIMVILPCLAIIASTFPKSKWVVLVIGLILLNLIAGIFISYFYFVYPDHLLIREAALMAKDMVGKNETLMSNVPTVVEYFSDIKTLWLPANETKFNNSVKENHVKLVLLSFSYPSKIFSLIYGKFVPKDIPYMQTIESYNEVLHIKKDDQAETIIYKIV